MRVALSIDVEEDAPPYLGSGLGLQQGLPRLLDLLARNGIPGTAFVLGRVAAARPEVARALVASGQTVACHGWDHRLPFFRSQGSLRDEIRRSLAAIEAATGRRATAYRAPRFSLTARLLRALVKEGIAVDSSVLSHVRLARARGRLVLLDVPEVRCRPYHPAARDPWRDGDSPIVEVPVTEFPPLRGSPLGLGVLNAHGLAEVERASEDASRDSEYVTFVIHPWEAVDLRDGAARGPVWLRKSASSDLSALETYLARGDKDFVLTEDLAREATRTVL